MASALSDSFDTPRAMRVIMELIKEANIHIDAHQSSADIRSLEAIGRWITKIVQTFGLDANASAPYTGLGWASNVSTSDMTPEQIAAPYAAIYTSTKIALRSLDVKSEALDTLLEKDVDAEFANVKSSDPEALAMPYLRAISRIRDLLRKAAPSASPETKSDILELSDQIRDIDLVGLGVYLDDRPDEQPALIKFIPADVLIAQREEKLAREKEKKEAKERAKAEKEKADKEKEEKAKVKPEEMFRGDEKWSEFDGEGMPTKTKEGEDVPKSALKKLRKEWERQKKAHEAWKATQA